MGKNKNSEGHQHLVEYYQTLNEMDENYSLFDECASIIDRNIKRINMIERNQLNLIFNYTCQMPTLPENIKELIVKHTTDLAYIQLKHQQQLEKFKLLEEEKREDLDKGYLCLKEELGSKLYRIGNLRVSREEFEGYEQYKIANTPADHNFKNQTPTKGRKLIKKRNKGK